ncbi:hypothetical protein [Salisediminibacterium halotolerans]|uniref:DUF2802 domain-containing protein n=1 Tax=Salisediminibacterium halotolerans TaxID=517425 RepID=A0A1H9SB59_9BACI|nr:MULTISPECIES: hypothetical protein [Salisediminibacterium]RLJ78114.1 hypothetical protein BCL39_0581 [Actinophytocola xinjiangensis]RPE88547.1 hypothetical protein EDD67_0878 [Salisediminibacterium halotolerans]TWG37091.1 hypothetical protein BCL52_0580 [Salisediminibacterium halotolerans]SER81805.1 hypothetical protein SAMN05444126_106113 [Salisediminibacterium haloalkalitolerans]GEL09038.1 hypothetical protein SHA02_24540 [Salisediminibacterium halotolerans]
MEWIIITLLAFAILLFIVSFFQKGAAAHAEEQVEQVSIQLMKEIYYMKKKLRKLEEEYMLDFDEQAYAFHSTADLKRDDVLAMFENGNSPEDIAVQTNRDVNDIEALLANEKQ